MKNINLGDLVKDNVTGIKGTAIARIQYMNGCVRYEVQPKMDKESKAVDAIWIDEQQIVVVKAKAKPKAKPRGGSRTAPPRMSTPR